MGLVDEILEVFLTDYHTSYRLLRQKIYRSGNFPPKNLPSDNTLSVTLARLRSKGYVDRKEGFWRITEKGKTHILSKLRRRELAEKSKGREKNLIVAFDIPENQNSRRKWLRRQLLNLNFSMLQESVWFGPGPLPEDLIRSLNRMKLLPCIKIFEARETEII
jgi:DNA-binding transcriptional regulator PaaX